MWSWRMVEPNRPLELVETSLPKPGPGELLLRVIACGLCHTDRGFLYGGVRPNAPLPLTLGHEIVGCAVEAGPGVEDRLGLTFVVPAVLPCGACDLCARGRGNVCRRQKMPGNDFDGGFASHFLAPARFLCPVPAAVHPVENLGVVADAVGTAYQSVFRAQVRPGDLAVVVGAGGVGTFAIQVAKLCGAHVVAIDVDADRLRAVERFADLALDASQRDAKAVRSAVVAFERERGIRPHGRKVLECSGSASGQETAFSLLDHDGVLAVVGFTLDKVSVRLSNLMAFDAVAFGNWGCLPERFPEILDHVAAGRIVLDPFVERHPMSRLNALLAEERHVKRPVLVPDFESPRC